jgi:NhaP-type Na+/H+ or K+/H+ antiporter
MGETSFSVTILMVITVLAGISAQVLGVYLKIPSIVFLLLFGILLGPDCLNILHPQLLGEGLESLVSLSVALILFEGGLSLQLRDLAKISTSLRNLVTLGMLVTLAIGGLVAHALVGLPWSLSFLYASLVVVTGPTVIGPLLRQVQVDRQVATLLEGEGVLIDPLGAIVAVVVLNVVLSGGTDASTLLTGLITRLSIGAAIGGAGGWLLGWFLRQAHPLSGDMKNLVVLASVWSLYGLAQHVRNESGLMASVVAGIVLSADATPELRSLRRFQGQLTILAVSVLFILLAADLPLADLQALGWGGVFTVLTLMLVARPLSIWRCTWNSDLNWRQKAFISWIGPKGIVSASVASLFAIVLSEAGIIAAEEVKALVFLTIMMTVLLQGTSARWLAHRLRLTAEQAKGAVIVGSNPLARLVARLFKERDEPAVLIDTNPEAIKQAEQENLPVVGDTAMDPEVLEKAGMDSIGTFLSMTTNGDVNLVLAERAVEEFDPPRVLAVFPPNAKSQKTKAQQAFTYDLSLKTWNEYLSNENVKLIETTLEDPGFNYQQTYLQALMDSGKLIPLLLERQGRLLVVQAGQYWQSGDRVICLLQSPQSKLMKRLSGGSQVSTGRTQLNLERVPAVQEVPLPPEFMDKVDPVSTTV